VINRHLFFDLDRTLWDFDENSKQALIQLFSEAQLQHYSLDFEDFHSHYVEINAKLWQAYGNKEITKEHLRNERFRKTLEKWKLHDDKLVRHFSDGYVEISPKQTQLFPNTLETLEELRQNGYIMHIITNGFKEVQYTKLENCKLRSYFDIIVCSEEIGINKPAPEIFHFSMNKAQTKPENSTMIGDDYEVDILGAERVGMKTYHFNPQIKESQVKHHNQITNLKQLPLKLVGL
jgi:putative hydrolase of the HAD superfamily